MAVTRKEMADLVWQHKAIRSHMKFLIESLSNLSMQSNQETAPQTPLNDRIGLYRWSLYDLKEGIGRHIELDERIFETLHGGILGEDIIWEHEEIKKQVDNLIRSVENAVYHKLCREELNKCTSDTIEGVSRMCEWIGVHMAKEERALR